MKPSDAKTTDATNPIEQADIAVLHSSGDQRGHPIVEVAVKISEIADQPQMTALCGAVMLAGLVRRDPALARTGLAMLTAHGLATLGKTWIKHSIKRTRPEVVLDGGHYGMRPGRAVDHQDGSFPSGHTSSAVAVAGAVALDRPALAPWVLGAAAAVAAIQVPRGKHYASDLAAGALVGAAACAATRFVFRLLSR